MTETWSFSRKSVLIYFPTMTSRRLFLKQSAAAGGLTLAPMLAGADHHKKGKPLFEISLAEWSLHKTLFGKKMTNLDFPRVSKEKFGITAVEYVNQFFKDKAKDKKYLAEMKKRAAGEGVYSVLIMIDGEGALGDSKEAGRSGAIEKHKRWVEAAAYLGCHSIRVNASSRGSYDEQVKLAADGLRRLTEFAKPYGIGVIVENHGGLSSNGAWLASVMKTVDHPGCGTLPDFGNFHLGGGKQYDRYKGVTELMPYAKAVSAKSHSFDANGNETKTDYMKMMKIVIDAGYHGYVGIEWEGGKPGEMEGIQLTKKLLETCRDKLSGA